MDTISKDKGLPRPFTIFVAVGLISLTDPCAILIITSLISPADQRAIPPPPPKSSPKLSFRSNIWVELADVANSGKVCLTTSNIDDPFKSHIVALPDTSKLNRLYNDYHFLSQANSTPQEIGILGSLKAPFCFSFEKTSAQINNILTPNSAFYRNASSWCSTPRYREPLKSHMFAVPKSLPPGWFLVCGDRAWTGVPSLPSGGPCTVGRLVILDPATPTLPKRINEDPDPKNLKSAIVSLLSTESEKNFSLLNQFSDLTFANKPDWLLAKHIHPVSLALTKLTENTLMSPNYRAAFDYFMLIHTIGCSNARNSCCLNFDDLQDKTQFAFYNIAELKGLLSAARVPTNFYSKDIFESISIPFMPNWLKQIFLICLSMMFTYSLSIAKNQIIKRVFPAQLQNKKGGDVGDGTYMDMEEWKRERDKETNFHVWKVQEDQA
ncbi:hypothetical protein WISP_11987 [Willisornis vidua]|uniref:Uncharacterized protein n=1 Tax=Willisornis vidua TaxID=1566151 RepID=A0ABQ9DXC3_9PASS|nr:hypothetical protein WISP_11987 [Willisornis vidua]